MIIRELRDDDIPEVAALYNEQVTTLPNCRPVELEEFRHGLRDLWPRGGLRDSRAIIVVSGGQPAGYVHIVRGDFTDVYGNEQSGGVIIFYTYKPTHRAAGQLLLNEAEQYVQHVARDSIWAYQIVEGYPFFGLGNLSDRAGHVSALLGANGYRPNEEWVVLGRETRMIKRPAAPTGRYEIAFSCNESSALVAELRLREELIGECRAYPRRAGMSPEDSLYISDLVIYPEQLRGTGLGRYLLEEMLWRSQELGYRYSLVKALLDNHIAQLLYTSVGYRVCDVSRGYHKSLLTGERRS